MFYFKYLKIQSLVITNGFITLKSSWVITLRLIYIQLVLFIDPIIFLANKI